ncbi:uncharacterized protein PAC_07974 [Phialocephala subalpina]|uniref:Nucleolar 27S pre-rRNA processing Urb2/Npa2 C-terminal domain-containing protein n=1 Tax=Phialocephala subalpina TaxID=576137 RepID=A0A1L7WZ93_9HELO|nr:uncharacterized protein PAC_07974 [Phialocephala subalpina]
MASKSRTAQEKLQELEKGAAPFQEQLGEAAKFIGTTLDGLRRSSEDGSKGEGSSGSVVYHGREAWLLRWLLKRLQAPKDDIPRRTPCSWWLLCYLLRTVPLVNAAQILIERNFISIVRLALEEADKRDVGTEDIHSESSSTEQGSPEKKSKKRKRSEEPTEATATNPEELSNLAEAIFAAVKCVVESAKVTNGAIEQGQTSAFVAEYMKAVLRTSAEEAAKILGSWLSLCQKILSGDTVLNRNAQNWLSHFIEIWQCHKPDELPYLQFSLHSTKSLLSLFRTLDGGEYSILNWRSQLEVLIARNIIVPAKVAHSEHGNSGVLETLARVPVLQNSANAAILFKVAIRCIQIPGARKRRRLQDDAWLAAVFSTLKAAILSRASNAASICTMLQSAIDFKVSIDLAVLRDIIWKYGLPKDYEDWNVVAIVLKLDGNTFLIPDEKHLLKELFERLTRASLKESWPDVEELVLSEVTMPLMAEFARARDLSGFLRHWYTQLVEFERLRKLASPKINFFCAWESDDFTTELRKHFESSLTIQQIVQILDWLQDQVTENPHAVCVILEAITGSISGDERVADAVGLRPYHILFDDGAAEKMERRYRSHAWTITNHSLKYIEQRAIDELAMLWEQGAKPFDILIHKDSYKHLLPAPGDSEYSYEKMEALSFACATLEVSEDVKGDRLRSFVQPMLVAMLRSLAGILETTLAKLCDGSFPTSDNSHTREIYVTGTDIAGAISILVQMLFWSPTTLGLGLELEGNTFIDMLQNIYWIASAGFKSQRKLKFPSGNLLHDFSLTWPDALRKGSLTNNRNLMKVIVDTMLKSTTNLDNPLIKADTNNTFTTHCLHMLRLEDISKSQREQIMKSWPKPESTVLDLPVLALKVKVMRHPAIYKGMRFKDLIELADILAKADVPRPQEHLALLKELTRLIFVAVHTNLDQIRNKTYVVEAFKAIQKKVSKASKKKQLDFALTGTIEVALVAFHEKEMALNDQDIIPRDDIESITKSFTEALVNQLKPLLTADHGSRSQKSAYLGMGSIINALAALDVDALHVSKLENQVQEFIARDDESGSDLKARLGAFMRIHSSDGTIESDLGGDVTTVSGRDLILQRTEAALVNKDHQQKLDLLQSIIDSDSTSLDQLDKLLAARHAINAIVKDKAPKGESGKFTLSQGFTILAEYLSKATEIRQFCLISETLELMLKTEGGSISQYSIDCTIGSITIFCSSGAPNLPPSEAGTIYTHLCRLLQNILMHHRLNLQGHSHLAQQAMQALLRCLFVPTAPTSSSATTSNPRFAAPPAWLQPLTLTHAQHFTKLLLLIADPPLSTLSQGRTNPLVSLKDKAKDMNVKMETGVREALMPGWFAVLETMNESGRDAMRGEMDSGGRAVFGGLFEEWRRVCGRRE